MIKFVDINTARKSGKNVRFDAKDSNTPYRGFYYLLWKNLNCGDDAIIDRMFEECKWEIEE